MSRYLGAKGRSGRLCSVFLTPGLGSKDICQRGRTADNFPEGIIVAGRNRNVQPKQKLVLRPVVGLTENLPKRDLEWITVEAIKCHRRLRDLAEERREQCKSEPPVDPLAETSGAVRIAYIMAMIEMHAQQTVLSTLLDVLGYIPSVPAD